jgi:hypothetical protein
MTTMSPSSLTAMFHFGISLDVPVILTLPSYSQPLY